VAHLVCLQRETSSRQRADVTQTDTVDPVTKTAIYSFVTSGLSQQRFRTIAVQCPPGALLAGVLYPAFGLLLSPIVAALAMSLSSVSVIANALRLRTLKL
jgi:cation transport ATPase